MNIFLEKKIHREKKDELDFDQLEKLHVEMKDSIDHSFENIEDRKNAILKIRRVFEHSINDGLRLGQEHGLTPNEWFQIVGDDAFVLKHKDFAKSLFLGLQKEVHNLDTPRLDTVTHVDNLAQKFTIKSDSISQEKRAEEILKRDEEFPIIDNYYGKILSQSEKEFSPIYHERKSDFTGTSNEKVAKEYLAKIKPWLDGQYYSMLILEKVYMDINAHTNINEKNNINLMVQAHKASESDISLDEFIKQSKTNKRIQEAIARYYLASQTENQEIALTIKNKSLFDTETLKEIKKNTSENLHADFEKQRRERLDIIYAEKRRDVEGPLLKEVQEKVTKELGNEYRVEVDENDTYIIKDTFEDKRGLTEQDSIEFAKAFTQFDQLYIKINEDKGYHYDPSDTLQIQREYPALYDSSSDISNEEYLDKRMDFIKQKEVIESIPSELTDQIKFNMLSQFKNDLIDEGNYEYAIQKIESLTNIPNEYIQALKESYDLLRDLVELKEKDTSEIKEREIFDMEKLSIAHIYAPQEIKGKLTFKAELENGKWVVIHDGKQSEEEYSGIYSLSEKDDFIIAIVLDGTVVREITIPFGHRETPLDTELQLLNTIHNPSIKKIEEVLGGESFEEESTLSELKKEFESTWSAAKFGMNLLKKNVKEILSLNKVKKTRAQNRTRLQLQQLLIPEVYTAMEEQRKNKQQWSIGRSENSWMRGETSGTSSLELKAQDYLSSQQERIGYQGGNPNEKAGKDNVVISSRYPLHQEYLALGYYASENNGKWSKSYIPLNTAPSGFTRENTITTAEVIAGSTIGLPLPVHSSYIKERIKAITATGEEIPVDIQIDSFGLGKVQVPNGAERITYSIQESMINETPSEMTEIEFQKVKKSIIIQESGKEYFTKIAGINEQDKLFIKSIELKASKERIKAIEAYVHDIGYYDFDNNDEVVAPKRNADSEELFYLMEDRMNEIRAKNPEKEFKNKRYAGVCDDYSKLTTALLRQSGIPSGLMTCFRAGNKTDITVGQAHATSFVLWRGSDGNISSYVVDGTPAGMTVEERELQVAMGIRTETIEEKEIANEEILEEIRKQAEQEIQEVEKLLENLTSESIKELQNGKLENALNMILAYDVEWEHVQALESVLAAYRYTPIYGRLHSIKDSKVTQTFLEKQINQKDYTGEYAAKHAGSAGSALFTIVKEFIGKENKTGANGLDDVERITELIQSSLTKNEHRSLTVIVQYLKAQKMLS